LTARLFASPQRQRAEVRS